MRIAVKNVLSTQSRRVLYKYLAVYHILKTMANISLTDFFYTPYELVMVSSIVRL